MNLDPIEKDIFIRYNMDHKIWKASCDNSFVHKFSIGQITGAPMILPLVFLLINRAQNGVDHPYFRTIVQTLVVSFCAYFVTDKAIDAFKDSLRDKGLFGRDLNKSGE